MTALIERKPLIRSAYWRLHQIVEDFLRPAIAESDYELTPTFSTRLSSIIDPDKLGELDARFIKDHPMGYMLLALPRLKAGRLGAADRVPIPLLAIDLTNSSIDRRRLVKHVRGFMPRYLSIAEDALERARGLITQELPSLAQQVKAALTKGGAPEDRKELESTSTREFMHVQERALFNELVRQAARTGLHVVGQAGLSDAIDISGPGFANWLERQPESEDPHKIKAWAKRHPVDFVLCSAPPVSLPLVLVEYDGMQKRRNNPELADAKTRQLIELAEWAELQLCRLRVDKAKGWSWSQPLFEEALAPVADQARATVLDPEFQGAVVSAIEATVRSLVGSRAQRPTGAHWLAQDHTCLIEMLLKRVEHLEKVIADREQAARDAPDPYENLQDDHGFEEHFKRQFEYYEYMAAQDLMGSWTAQGRKGAPPWSALGIQSGATYVGGVQDPRVQVTFTAGPSLSKAGVKLEERISAPIMMIPYGHRRDEVFNGYCTNLRTRLENTLAEKFRPKSDELHRLYCDNIG